MIVISYKPPINECLPCASAYKMEWPCWMRKFTNPSQCMGKEKYLILETLVNSGAGNGVRTRDTKLGKLVLYQLSYARLFMRACLCLYAHIFYLYHKNKKL